MKNSKNNPNSPKISIYLTKTEQKRVKVGQGCTMSKNM